ncbi:ciliary basal body-associated, B9 protein-domain-containing protein [Chytriomyces sp. MP71]|nr:ciliary basal body-associated, B9 protein-domain-containing protein [Chytriomyces sp. MP71]
MLFNEDIKTDLNGTRYYRTIDQLENFKLRIILRKVADRRVPLSHLNHGAVLHLHRGDEKSIQNASSSLLPSPEEILVRWQKKILSPKEIADKKNAKAASVKSAFKIAKEATDGTGGGASQGGMFLFTYVDADDFLDEEELHRHLTTAKEEDLTDMARRVLTLTKPILAPPMPHENHTASYHLGITEVPMHMHKPMRDLKFSVMHIMAYIFSEMGDLKDDHLTMKSYEKRLCTIKCYDSGLVTMTPGMSPDSEIYQFQINEDVFQYRIELVSKDLDPEDEENEWKIYSEFYNRRLLSTQSALPTSFQRPPPDPAVRLHLLAEITSVRYFHGDSLYIHYLLDLAEGWSVEGGQLPLLSAYTQCSGARYSDALGGWEAVFGFPIEVELISGRGSNPPIWPRIYFEVCSMDAWDRNAVVGYGYVDLPRTPGCHQAYVRTWKPVVSPYSQMKTLLVGGSAELDDITYDAVPFGHTGTKLNKYGFQTETSGEIVVKMNLMHQQGKQSTSVEHDALKVTDPTQFVKNNAQTIAEAISRAKERLQAIRMAKKTH